MGREPALTAFPHEHHKTEKNMSNRVAFVTGGAQGSGKGNSDALGAAGFRVAVADLNLEVAEETAAGIRDAGGQAIAVPVDVTDTASVQAAVKQVAELFGPVEIVVNLSLIHI